jgi:hypothetical protein
MKTENVMLFNYACVNLVCLVLVSCLPQALRRRMGSFLARQQWLDRGLVLAVVFNLLLAISYCLKLANSPYWG